MGFVEGCAQTPLWTLAGRGVHKYDGQGKVFVKLVLWKSAHKYDGPWQGNPYAYNNTYSISDDRTENLNLTPVPL